MKVAVDTNVLVRAAVGDDPDQARRACDLLTQAELVVVAMPSLCEFVWVLLRVYRFAADDAAKAIRALLACANVQADRPAAQAGLALLEAGGDFADGAIAYEGRWLGADAFVSFDKQAVALLKRRATRRGS